MKKIVLICSLCVGIVLIGIFAKMEKKSSDSLSRVTAEGKSEYSLLTDKDILSYMSKGLSWEEINYLVYLKENYNNDYDDVVDRIIKGENIENIIKSREKETKVTFQFSEDEKYILFSDLPAKSETKYKLEDFLPITIGMSEMQVTSVLDGRRYNKIVNTNIDWKECVYELESEGEIWLIYSPDKKREKYSVSRMLYIKDDKEIVMLEK